MVAISHFDVYNHIFRVPVFWNAGYYVDFFFVLSGFVIFANYEKRLQAGFGIARFMGIRFGRLYPLHVLTLALFVLHECAQFVAPSARGDEPFSGPGESPFAVLANVLLLQSFGVVGSYSFNSPSWSISAEFYTYLLFALLIERLPSRRSMWMTACLVLGFFYFQWFDGKEATHNGGVLRCIYGFAAGGLCWVLWVRYQRLLTTTMPRRFFWTLAETVTMGWAFYLVNALGDTMFVSITPFVFGALIYVFAFERGFFSGLLRHRFFLLLGALSYSIYMIHAFVSWKIINTAVQVLSHFSSVKMTTLIDGQHKLGLEFWQGDLLTLVYLAVVIGISYVSYRYFEVPCRDYFKRVNQTTGQPVNQSPVQPVADSNQR